MKEVSKSMNLDISYILDVYKQRCSELEYELVLQTALNNQLKDRVKELEEELEKTKTRGLTTFYFNDRNNKDFQIFKFRSMRVGSDKGSLVTIGGRDPRITKSGYFIRKFKIDELPQLINVFIGDMSLVGPRPEVRHYVNYWTTEQMHVLDVRPGITDPASIRFRNENELLEKAEDPEKYYIEVVMQEKIKLYLDYVKHHSFFYDLKLIFQTFWVIITE